MKKLLTLFSFLIISAFSMQLLAQEFIVQDRSGFGFRLGYYEAQDADDGTMFIGVQSRTRGEYVGAEFAVEYRGDQSYSATGGDITVRQIPVTGSLLVFAPIAQNFAPYGLAGLGAYYTLYDYNDGFLEPGDDSELNFGYHFGIGAEVALSETAIINVDYRYLFLDGNDEIIENEFSGNVITAGLTFYF
ncbi:MAG: porin family protein [Balneolaceae bacterium]